MARGLTEKQQRYLQLVAAGKQSRFAAREAGYSETYAEAIATRSRKNPDIAAAIESIRTEGRTLAAYDLVAAMKEADDAATFAKKHKNPMANVKAVELRAKLSGLLIERVETFSMDLRGSLEEAQARVLNIASSTSEGTALDLIASDPLFRSAHLEDTSMDVQGGDFGQKILGSRTDEGGVGAVGPK